MGDVRLGQFGFRPDRNDLVRSPAAARALVGGRNLHPDHVHLGARQTASPPCCWRWPLRCLGRWPIRAGAAAAMLAMCVVPGAICTVMLALPGAGHWATGLSLFVLAWLGLFGGQYLLRRTADGGGRAQTVRSGISLRLLAGLYRQRDAFYPVRAGDGRSRKVRSGFTGAGDAGKHAGGGRLVGAFFGTAVTQRTPNGRHGSPGAPRRGLAATVVDRAHGTPIPAALAVPARLFSVYRRACTPSSRWRWTSAPRSICLPRTWCSRSW